MITVAWSAFSSPKHIQSERTDLKPPVTHYLHPEHSIVQLCFFSNIMALEIFSAIPIVALQASNNISAKRALETLSQTHHAA
jgi:hypothetical protein